MTKSESKYFNTAKKMDEALLSLMEKKDFEYITVTEICERAGVNRSTFYLHYETIGDLLNECIEQMNQDFLTYFEETTASFSRGIDSASLDELFLITPKYLIPYLTYISDNKNIFKVVLQNPRVMQTDKTYNNLFSDILNRILARHNVPESRREYMLSFYVSGTMGIINRWLLSDCRESVDEIADIMMLVIRR